MQQRIFLVTALFACAGTQAVRRGSGRTTRTLEVAPRDSKRFAGHVVRANGSPPTCSRVCMP